MLLLESLEGQSLIFKIIKLLEIASQVYAEEKSPQI